MISKKRKKVIILFLIFVILFTTLLISSRSLAKEKKDTDFWEIDYPGGGPDSNQLPDYMLYIYRLSFTVGTFLAVVMIIIGGIQWSASTANPSVKADAKDRITKALLGLVLLFGSYLILNTINPELVVIKDIDIPEDARQESGADTVTTIIGQAQCEANTDKSDLASIEAKKELPLCGDYCYYYCTGNLSEAEKMDFPESFWQQERSELGLTADFGYMVGHDPGSGKDVVWCGCYSLPGIAEEEKELSRTSFLEKEGVSSIEELEEDKQKELSDKLLEEFGFKYLGKVQDDNMCEYLDTARNNCRYRCGNACFDRCRREHSSLAGEGRVLGVISSSNEGAREDLTWCNCYKTPSADFDKELDNGEKEHFDFRINYAATYGYPFSQGCDANGENCCSDNSYCKNNECRSLPEAQPCEAAGDAYPRCGNYCYDFCKEKGFKFGVVSAGNFGAGLDEAYCTCFK